MTELLQTLFNGLVASGIYLLIALGLTIVFGLTRLINFAHGQMLVVGTFIAYAMTSHGYPFWLAVVVSTIIIGLFGGVLERTVFRRTLSNPLNGLIVGLGVLIVLQWLVIEIWGLDPVSVRPMDPGRTHIGEVSLSYNRVAALMVAVIAACALLALIFRTPMGRRMSATQQDTLAASHVGINTTRVIQIAFIVGSALAGTGGAVLGTLYPVGPYDGGDLILKGFAVVLLGGLGNIPGAIVASLIYGVGESLVAGYWSPAWVGLYTFGLIIVVLLVRPSGLFGSASDASPDPFAEDRPARAVPPIRLPRYGRGALALIAVGGLVLAFQLVPTAKLQAAFVIAMIYAIVVYSLSLLYHNAGMLSVAQGAMMGLGAYTAGLLASHLGWGFWPALVPAFLVSACAGALVGFPVSRARGHYFLLLTFAFGALVVIMMNNLKSLTGGDQGLAVLEPPGAIGPVSFNSLSSMYYLSLAFAVGTVGVVYAISRTSLGARLASIRDNEHLALSLGLDVRLYKIIVFAISGGLAGIGGVLFLYYQTIVVPSSFSVLATIQFVIMLILGGKSVFGPAVGVLLMVLLPQVIGLDPTTTELVYGLILIAVILLLPKGIVPESGAALARLVHRFSKASGAHVARSVSPVPSRDNSQADLSVEDRVEGPVGS